MQTIVITIGGALGALARYNLGLWVCNKWNQSFPLHTFLLNVSGAFLLGFINILLSERLNVSPLWRLGLGVGFLGAFTTFSTFGYEVISLMEDGNLGTAALYTLLSILIGFCGTALGIYLARLL